MAAVLALIMIPIVAAVGFFVGTFRGGISVSAAFAMATFVSLSAFVLINTLRIAWQAENAAD